MYEWQLTDLYPSYQSTEFQNDWNKLSDFVHSLTELELKDDVQGVKEAITLLEDLAVLSQRLGQYIHLNLAVNTSDTESNNMKEKFAQVLSQLTKPIVGIRRFLSSINITDIEDQYLANYQFLFEELKQQAQYMLSDEVEEVIAKMDISGGQSWSNLQSYLTSIAEENLDGQELTLTELRNLAFDSDEAVRRSAYQAELKLYDQIKEPIAFAINNIKKQVLTTSQMRGYQSPLEETLIQSRMSQTTLDTMLGAIKDYLPEFQRYLKLKAEYLGNKSGLPFYNLFAPMGKSKRKFTVEEAKDFLVTNFEPFSNDLAELVKEFFDKKYIDFLPRKGKTGGAFCSNQPYLKQSRIMMNFDGSLSSVITLAHELGHAYHGEIIQDHLPLNWSYTMPVAETASTFNETIVMNNLLKESQDSDEKLALIESLLQDTTQIMVDIYSRYYFESHLFDRAEKEFLFSQQLEELMVEAQKAAYGDGLDSNYLHPYMWINKGHYYSANLSFYNFPYAFGGLFARGLYTLYEQEPNGFVDRYHELLRMTTISSVEDTAKVMGIDLTQVDFWRKSLDSFVSNVDLFEQLVKK